MAWVFLPKGPGGVISSGGRGGAQRLSGGDDEEAARLLLRPAEQGTGSVLQGGCRCHFNSASE